EGSCIHRGRLPLHSIWRVDGALYLRLLSERSKKRNYIRDRRQTTRLDKTRALRNLRLAEERLMTAHRQAAPRITDPAELAAIAKELRRDVIRMISPRGQGYVLQGLGAADLFSTLFFAELRLSPGDNNWADRDRFILSTAHNTAVFYA